MARVCKIFSLFCFNLPLLFGLNPSSKTQARLERTYLLFEFKETDKSISEANIVLAFGLGFCQPCPYDDQNLVPAKWEEPLTGWDWMYDD